MNTFTGRLALSGLAALGTVTAGLPDCLMHAQAIVNDSSSHGILGDNRLSLNEAILLHNGQLQLSQLSTAEANQVSGFSSDISEITIDALAVPNVTVSQDLEPIADSPHGLLIEGINGRPVIDFANSNVHHGFRAASDLCSWRNLVIQGGVYAIVLSQTNAVFGGTVIDNVLFDGQSQFAISASGTTVGGMTRLLLDQCAFQATPRAVLCDESPANRTSVIALFHSRIEAAIEAVKVVHGTGGLATMQIDSTEIDCPGLGLQILRLPGSTRPLQWASTHLDITAGHCIDLVGSPGANSALELRMLHLTAAPGGIALRVGPAPADAQGVIEDSRMRGDCLLLNGSGTTDLRLENTRITAGNVLLGAGAAQGVDLVQVAFQQCTTSTFGVGVVQPFGCSFQGGQLSGTPTAPIHTSYCHVTAQVGTSVVQQTSLPTSPLADFQLSPASPGVGSVAQIDADFPPGLLGIFAVGPTVDTPLLLTQPIHIYFDLASAVILPGVHRQQDTLLVAIPPVPQLIGTDWTCHCAVVPDPGVIAPDLQLPPARRVLLR